MGETIIELTGHPGSGKTYTRDLLYDRLKKKGVKVWKPKNKIRDLRIMCLCKFLWRCRTFLVVCLKLIHPQKDLLLWKYWLVQILNYCSIPKEHMCLFDEGWTQFGVSIRWGTDKDMSWYYRLKPPSIIIHIDTPMEVCMERMKERGYPKRWLKH